MAQFKTSDAYLPTGDQPQAIETIAEALERRRAVPDAARCDRHGQDRHDGVDRSSRSASRRSSSPTTRRWPRSSATSSASSSRRTRSSTSSPTTTTTSPRRTSRRPTSTSRRTRPGTTTSTGCATRRPRRSSRGETSIIVASVSAIYGLGSPEEYEKRARDAPRRRGAGPRPHAPEADRHPVHPQRRVPRPRPLPRQGRRDRDPAGVRGVRVPDLDVRRRDRADHPLRPADRRGLRAARLPEHLPGNAVRDLEADDRARRGRDPPRARGAGEAVRVRGPHARGAPDPAAHRVRRRDDGRARLLQRDRELLADPRRAAGRARRRTR